MSFFKWLLMDKRIPLWSWKFSRPNASQDICEICKEMRYLHGKDHTFKEKIK